MTAPVLAANRWPTNAHLIADCARLGHLNPGDLTLDPTYGKGNWWTLWRPDRLHTNDLHVPGADWAHDFRDMPIRAATYDAITYDPPYAAHGGRDTSTIPDFNAAYGRDTAPRTPQGVQQLINDGLDEMARLIRPRGIILVKCQAYVWSGKLWPGDHLTLTHALGLGLELIDRLEMITSPRPQPARTRADGQPVRQHHARRNLSTMFVFRAPKAPQPTGLFA